MKQIERKLPAGGSLCGYLREASGEMPEYPLRPAVIVCPGGGYEHLSAREADPVATYFLAAGYHTFLLSYSLGAEATDWRPMIQLAQAILCLRKNAAEWGIMPEKIAVCGFSAGAHLAATAGLLWDAAPIQAAVNAPGGENRADALILCYPVITAGPFAHRGSFDAIAGQDAVLAETFSLEKQVRPDMPPTFVWHTVPDPAVPVQNTLLLVQAMAENHVPYELHLFAEGGHGMSTCTHEVNTPNTHNAQWMPLCREWLDNTFGFSVL